MKILPLIAAALLLSGAPAFAQDANKSNQGGAAATMATAPSPQQFATTAGVSNLFEIASSKLALTKAQSADVKTFAQRMVDDHTKAGDEMATAAKSDSVAPPADLDQANQTKLNQLNGMSGDAFDKAYVSAQTQAHADAVALFQTYASNGNPGALKDFAAKTLPTLQEHYAMVQKISM